MGTGMMTGERTSSVSFVRMECWDLGRGEKKGKFVSPGLTIRCCLLERVIEMHIFAQWLARLCPSPHVGFIFRKGCNVRARGASVSERVTVDQAEWRTLKAHSPSRKE
ncbi:hypothetical protein ASPFODRAFT_350621 [Aspergillus luchuensis CBS 106.47]|uniref:Uncharacterized protein n=1 Tax=Aspergillus luchuensis (strain CBS 106.47) TaxID=1137211 RepID=A0A1M3T698_ASPLC|nr:hypothetical protein ASPFODRAFT_350621 [Aspergillus luchuensis CBS 106.47]